MQDRDHPDLLIIRRGGRDDDSEDVKGGVWKIAYADFMTAMMAFFLVMWLVNVTDQETKESVARYFNPIRFAEATVDRKGVRDPEPRPPVDGEREGQGKAVPAPPQGPAKSGAGTPAPGRHTASEATLFQDPYAVLAAIAQKAPADAATGPLVDPVAREAGRAGPPGGDQPRDPFDPIYWQAVASPSADRGGGLAQPPGPQGPAPRREAASLPGEGERRPGAPRAREVENTASPTPVAEAQDPKQARPAPGPADRAAAAASRAQEARDAREAARSAETKSAETKAAEATERRVAELRDGIAAAVGRVPAAGAPEIRVEGTGEGLLVSLTDAPTFGMFAIGSAEPRPEMVRIVERVAAVLARQPGTVVVRGHTDGRPFRSREYDNWRLSSARAHMAAYMLVRGGIPEARIERVEGWADRSLKVAGDPGAAANRRIEILVREARP